MGKILDFFKGQIQLNIEYYASETKKTDSPKDNALFCPTDDCIFLIYEFGHLFKIYPVPNCDYQYCINIVQDASFIISDGVQYDLSCKEAILAIEIPGYDVHLKSKIDKAMGKASSLEFALLEKGNKYWRQKNYDLAIACYGKATQLMAVSDEYLDDKDFYLIVKKLDELGRHKHADKWREWIDKNAFSFSEDDYIEDIEILREIDPIDRETMLVSSITTDDMKKFIEFSYDFDCPIEKSIQYGSHPYAYINLNIYNQSVAKKDLELLAFLIKRHPEYSAKFFLDTSSIIYLEYNPDYGYTKLICTPKTLTGKISKYPVSLYFMSRMDIKSYQCIGTIDYLKDGSIGKANVNIWRRKSCKNSAEGRKYYFESVDGNLQILKIEYL